MTGVEVRDTQYAAWSDPDAWMETMKGPKWNAVLQEEDFLVQVAVKQSAVQSRLGLFQQAYRSAKEKLQPILFEAGPITVHWHNLFFKTWWFTADTTVKHTARDIVVGPNTIWCTEDVGDGAEAMELQCWSPTKSKPIWKKFPVGQDIGLVGTNLVYLNIENRLVSHELWWCDSLTGKHTKRLYKEQSPHVNLALEKHADGRLKLVCDNSQDVTVYEILVSGSLLKRHSKHPIPSSWILPLGTPYGIEFVWQREGLIVLKRHGTSALWKCAPNKPPKKLGQLTAGQILFDPFAVWAGKVPTKVYTIKPDVGAVHYTYTGMTLQLEKPIFPTGLVTQRVKTYSKDGTQVHGIVTYKANLRPSYLLVIGYGAYGMPTSVGSVLERWAPLVQNGWAIGHAFIRGGGDHTDAWAKAGRLGGRVHTIDDFIAIVETIQSHFQIHPKRTCIYGRSAGGLLVGDTLTRYPTGSLMCCVYTEVPYVDELRTTTNPSLPLTELEANEFGNPLHRLEDFIDVALLSPADSAITLQTPNIFVLARTAENDSQVFTYESVKWIRRLRNAQPLHGGAPKLCIIERDQGHFTVPEDTVTQWSLDCALLDTWIHRTI